MKLCCVTLFLCVSIISLTGCTSKPPEQNGSQSKNLSLESAHRSGVPASEIADANLEFTAPAGWVTETPSSSNRQAQYKLPRAGNDSEDAELVAYHFSGGGGTPQANIDRWIGQFRKADGTPASDTAKITRKNINGIAITTLDVSGSYEGSMMPGQTASKPKTDFRMLAAIAETGSSPWFFKLTGPAKTVAKWQSSFDIFLSSIREKK
jgi:hypothetical protein